MSATPRTTTTRRPSRVSARCNAKATTAPKLIVDVTDVWGQTFASDVRVVGDRIQGSVTSGSFCGDGRPSRYTLYFSMRVSQPITDVATWNRGEKVPVEGRTAATGDAVISLAPDPTAPVVTTTGISYASIDGAEANRVAETATRTPGRAKSFYTDLYHGLLHPSVAEDVDGTYQGFDGRPHKVAAGHDYYQMLSLWDTYRSQNQLVALLEPQRATDVARTILDVYRQAGWVPRWALGQAETNATSGDPVTPFVVSLYSRGLLDHELANRLFAALWKNVNETPPPATGINGRAYNPDYLSKGYVPSEDFPGEAASVGLEYSLADCALGTMAIGLGRTREAKVLRPRCEAFKNIWNPDATSKGSTGFPQVRAADGGFVPTGDVVDGTGFKEGTAWQYQWLGAQNQPPAMPGAIPPSRAPAE
ncbi:glycoside hydrolase domain-containing protein [Actinoallomurus acaciae]|uniref:Glycoside hydrolase domain-containing protein n=1 Tax=Actinoallomurus acaciae TaxID=502577 RepID=A0ABV5YJ75_9ACTN